MKKVLSRAHMCSLEQRVRNAHDQNEQTLLHGGHKPENLKNSGNLKNRENSGKFEVL